MNMPGFTAEASLGPTNDIFQGKVVLGRFSSKGNGRVVPELHKAFAKLPASGSDRNMVVPQLSRLPPQLGSCGPCTPLTWPNGTRTGACVQDCTDILGNHRIQACACGGGGIGGIFGGVFRM
jgi:hypothetical protein